MPGGPRRRRLRPLRRGACDDPGEDDDDTDCDDTSSSVYPGATEIIGDGIDQDCDGEELCPVDGDDDGYATAANVASATLTCAVAPGGPLDCDDADAAIHPGATEGLGDALDSDCDGLERCPVDGDDDAYTPDPATERLSSSITCDEPGLTRVPTGTGDCDDADPSRYPGASEDRTNNLDDDCDGWDENRDRDDAGIPDLDEPTYGTDPDDPDSDGGGVPDGPEILRGSDPLTGDDEGLPESWIQGRTCSTTDGSGVPLALFALLALNARRRRAGAES